MFKASLWPDPNDEEPEPKTAHLPDYFLQLTELAIQPDPPLEYIKQEVNSSHYAMGNLYAELFEWRTPNVNFFAAFYALNAAYLALKETVYNDKLSYIPVSTLSGITDENWHNLPRYRLDIDAAAAAMLAIIGSNNYEKDPPTSSKKRAAFWQWWLLTALPEAHILAGDSHNKTP